jgi:hypothetical protein
MKVNILQFCNSCDICQKTKPSNFTWYRYLISNPIPSKPYDSISMDFIVNLPWSGEFNAVFVVVDRLTKHANFIPTTTGVDAKEFSYLFVKHIACGFGLATSIIADRDPQWTSDFWKGVAKHLKTRMSLSLSHHPQHDRQTEIVYRNLETMIRAYVAEDKTGWAKWLHLLEFAYNLNPHALTRASPLLLMFGFEPKTPLDFILCLTTKGTLSGYKLDTKEDTACFLDTLSMHRESARQAIVRAQHNQAQQYNKGHCPVPEFKKGDLAPINPHSLEWVKSKGKGAKLVQRWIGPFKVVQKINAKTYRLHMDSKYPGLPIFNIDHLKKYIPSPPEFRERTVLPETRRKKLAKVEYDIEYIVGHKRIGKDKSLQYLIRWTGYGLQFDMWEPASSLVNAQMLLLAYKRKHHL